MALLRRPKVVVLLVACGILLPASTVPVLSGIPIGIWPGAFALVVAAAGLSLAPGPRGAVVIALTVAGCAAGMGLALKVPLAFVPDAGFDACYRVGPQSATAACARSYDEPFNSSFTRTDPAIRFGSVAPAADPPAVLSESTWSLSAANASDLNFFLPDQPNRERLPLAVDWSGAISHEGAVAVRYIGEGEVDVQGERISMDPAYEAIGEVRLPTGYEGPLTIRYIWDPGTAYSQEGPYAFIGVVDSSGAPVPAVDEAPAFIGWLSWLCLVLLATGVAGLSAAVVLTLFGSRLLAIVTLAAAAAVTVGSVLVARGMRPLESGVWTLTLMAVFGLLTVARRGTAKPGSRLMATLVLPAYSFAFVAVSAGSLAGVTYRLGGEDNLTYEGFARSILEGDGFRAGEDVFVYSPGFRYLLFVQHLVTGDDDRLIYAAGVAALLAGAWFAVDRLLLSPLADNGRLHESSQWRTAAAFGLPALIAMFVGSGDVLYSVGRLMSEYPTWILLCFAFPLVLQSRTNRGASLAAVLLGLMLLTRGNQLPGVAVLSAVLIVRRWRAISGWTPRLVALACVALPLLVLASIPGIHNWLFGDALVLLQTSVPLPSSFPLSPLQLVQAPFDLEVMSTLRSQLAGVLVLTASGEIFVSWAFLFSVRLIQAGVLVSLGVGLAHRFHGRFASTLLVFIPAAFLVPHVFVQVLLYYPRHVVVGYLAAALCLLAIVGTLMRPREIPAAASSEADRAPV